MKGFYIEITNNLLDHKHYAKMKDSVWLFMWLLDKMTSIDENGIGNVLGGKPIKYEDIRKDLGISLRTYRRWVEILISGGYINSKRTPCGCVLSVNKARKRFGRRANHGTSDMPNVAHRGSDHGTSIYVRQYNDNNNRHINNYKNNLTRLKKLKYPLMERCKI